MKISIDRKILIGFIVCSGILVVVAIISFRNSKRFTEANQLVNHTHEVLHELEQVLVSTINAETGARGFVITGRESFLEPFDSAKINAYRHIERTGQLTRSNSEVQRILVQVEKLIHRRFAHLENYIQLRKAGNFEQAKAVVGTGGGKELQDQVRTLIDNARTIEKTLLTERRQASEEDVNNFNVFFIILLSVIAAILLIVYVIITSNLKALNHAQLAAAEKNWSLTGSGKLIKAMQGNKHLNELSQVIINHLATYLNAQVGAIYVADENNMDLRLEGAYAFDKRKKDFPAIKFGEGIVGQAAAEKRMILVTDIPTDHFIDTGFGKISPKNIITIPFVFENKVTIGVIELGSFYSFTELQKQYLELVVDSISIAVTSSQTREKTKDLLEETQRQAEELEVQQEELKQANEELYVKTETLESTALMLEAQQGELHEVNVELEEKATILEEQKERLEYAKAEIENKVGEIELTSKYKSEFLANMSHELRTPLNSILILAQLLSENKHNTLGEKDVEFAKNIHHSGTDLLDLINEILDLSKVEAGKMQLDITEVSLQDIFNNMSSVFSEVAKNKSIDFNIDCNEEIAQSTIRTDHQHVEQILKNLLSNAFKFTDKGGSVSLIVGPRSDNVLFKNKYLNQVTNVMAFSVRDTGIGIPVEKQGIVFEAFQQADGSTKRKYGGTGLGLSISHELANILGGEIHLESEEGKGSTFTLNLPIQFDPSTIITPHLKQLEQKEKVSNRTEIIDKVHPEEVNEKIDVFDDRENVSENDRVILIIEDEEKFAQVLLGFIKERKYKGIIAHEGNTGISYARHYRPEAILLDMKLPVMGGLEVLKQIKNDPDLRHIPVQIISSYGQKKEVLEMGAFDYLQKPVTINDLQKVFDRIEKFANKKLKKLLIIEDNKELNNAIRAMIGNDDVKCFSAYLGAEAYEMLTNDTFDCIIVDLGLPDMSGFELLEKIKANKTLNKIPVVVYTGRNLKKDETERLNKLADTVVLKTADSTERLLDETILFLHSVEAKLPKEKQRIIRSLHRADEILKNKKILLIDDDVRNIYSLTNVLEEEGLQCLTAENGKIALKILKENPFVDLVLMDLMMPEMDGYEATTEIRKLIEFKKLPIIALTAKAMKGDKEKCLAVGMSDYISKPVNVEQLLSLMRVWLYR